MSNSPFGGIIGSRSNDLIKFFKTIEENLKEDGVNNIQITQCPNYYPFHIASELFFDSGYNEDIVEINQYVDLRSPIQLHEMEKRKLNRKSALKIEIAGIEKLPEIYDFIAFCRKEKGLKINIELEKLERLFSSFKNQYEIIIGSIRHQMVAVIIMCLATEKVAYYYLPATHPDYKTRSPMVHLMNYAYSYYAARSIEYLDLGISSINGELQTSLFNFKKHMGAQSSKRISYSKHL